MRLYPFKTVRNKFMVPTLLLTVLLFSLLGLFMAMSSVSALRRMLYADAGTHADFMVKMSVPAYKNFDYIALDNLAMEMEKQPEVDFVVFYNPEGKPLTKETGQEKASFIVLDRNIVDQSGTCLGRLRFGVNSIAISRNLRASFIIISIGVSAAILLLIFGMRMLTERVIIGAIMQMKDVAEKMASGDFTSVIETKGEDEIAALGKTINGMASNLQDMLVKMRNLHEDLERRVKERTAQLETANKDLESFSYSVSHDLRAPLRVIDGFARIIAKDYADKLDEEGRRLFNIITVNSKKMWHLIDDILSFSRVGRKEVNKTEVNMEELARDVWDELEVLYESRDIQVDIKPLPNASGDEPMLRQVFVNLMSNAAKFAKPGQETIIEVGALNENGRDVYYVKDNGIGFDMQYADKLFAVFQRLHAPEEYEGTGIGLAIVKKIIDKHNGIVRAEGRLNEGATFYFTLG